MTSASGSTSLAITADHLNIDNFGYHYDGASVPLHLYTPVEFTVNASEADFFYWQP